MKHYILRPITNGMKYEKEDANCILQLKYSDASSLAKAISNITNSGVNIYGFTIEIIDTRKPKAGDMNE